MPFVDLTRPQPPRPPVPSPPATPVPTAAIPRWLLGLVAALSLGVATLGGLVAWEHLGPDAQVAPAVGVKLGKAYARDLAAALAAGFDALASGVDAGKPLADADKDLKAAFQAARVASFAQSAAPAFAAIVPEGTEPKDPAARAAYAALARDFAKGLRGGK